MSRSNATTEGSLNTTPLPFIYTSTFAVPRSIPISLPFINLLSPFKTASFRSCCTATSFPSIFSKVTLIKHTLLYYIPFYRNRKGHFFTIFLHFCKNILIFADKKGNARAFPCKNCTAILVEYPLLLLLFLTAKREMQKHFPLFTINLLLQVLQAALIKYLKSAKR